MRRYRNLVEASATALCNIFNENRPADRVVSETLTSNKKWGSRDRKFIAATIYENVRWYRLLYETLGYLPVSVNDWWKMIAINWILNEEELPEWEELKDINPEEISKKIISLTEKNAIKHSIPDWFENYGKKYFKDRWNSVISSLNTEAHLFIRINSLKSNAQQLSELFSRQQINIIQTDLKNCFRFVKKMKITSHEGYKNGWFEIQDYASQMVAHMINPKPGEFIIDGCAGAGGKSLHLADLMKNNGKIIALDIYKHKLNELNKRAKRAGAEIIETALNTDNILTELKEKADHVLIDVPCSGLGTLKRSPHIKWRFDEDQLKEITKTQFLLLKSFSETCKINGTLNYSTCSILPEENENQIIAFLNSSHGKNFRLISQRTILPDEFDSDGFFIAKLQRVK